MSTLVYRSSAGSGKTYTLAKNFLLLVLSNGQLPNYSEEQTKHFRNILAVTFTKKATAEMKQRIVKNLYEIASATELSLNTMAQTLMQELGIEEQELIKRAQFQLELILEQYGDLNISTIDSFFRTVLSSFSLELDNNANMELELDTNVIKNGVVDILFKNLSEQDNKSQLYKSFISFLYDAFYNNNELIDLKRNLNEQVDLILKPAFQEQAKEILASYDDIDLLLNFRRQVFEERNKMIAALQNEAQAFLNFCSDNQLVDANFEGSSRGLRANVETLLNNFSKIGKIKTLINEAQFLKAITVKKEKLAHPLNESIEILANNIQIQISNFEEFETIVNKFKRLNASTFIVFLFQFLQQYKQDNRIIPIEEVNFLIEGITKGNELHFIYEKLGRKIKHLFIDEFQDTNEMQWRNLLPIIENNNTEGKFNLIVGDVKQSIYKFRGGDLELLQSKIAEDIAEQHLVLHNLADNYRSYETVVEFNNALYQNGISKYIQEHLDKLNHQEASKVNYLTDAYKDAAQNVKTGVGKGFVSVNFYHSTKLEQPIVSEESDFKELETEDQLEKEDTSNLAQVFDKIYELLEKGVSMGDIAILIFKNNEGQIIANYSKTYAIERNKSEVLRFISSDGLRLGGARVIGLLISALKFLINPYDEVHMYALFTQYMNIIGKPAQEYEFELNKLSKNLKAEYAFLSLMETKREEWLRLSVYAVIAEVITHLKLMDYEEQSLKGEILHLNTFLQQAHDYTQKQCGDLNSFLKWFEASGIQATISTPESEAAIRILTIHKSKGLEFPIVFLPFFNVQLYRETFFEWVKNTIQYDKYSKSLLEFNGHTFDENIDLIQQSEFRLVEKNLYLYENLNDDTTSFFNKRAIEILDNLNKIYVATTRAEKACYIYIKSNFILKELLENSLVSEIEAANYNIKYQGFTRKKEYSGYWMFSYFLNSPYFKEQLKVSTPDYASFQFGNEDSIIDKGSHKLKTFESSGYFSTKIPFYSVGNRLSVRNIAKDFFEKELHHQLLIESSSAAHIDQKLYGTVLHKVLAEISPETDIEYICNELVVNGELSEGLGKRLAVNLRLVLEREELKPYFDRSKYQEVFTEKAIIEKDEYGKTSTYIPDRVLINEQNIVLIDFKSGEEREEHFKQINKYKSLLSTMYVGKETLAYLIYISEEKVTTIQI